MSSLLDDSLLQQAQQQPGPAGARDSSSLPPIDPAMFRPSFSGGASQPMNSDVPFPAGVPQPAAKPFNAWLGRCRHRRFKCQFI